MDVRVQGIADRMLSHYNQFNEEICNAGARMGDVEDDLTYDECADGVEKAFRGLRNWSRANNKEKKQLRLKAAFTRLSPKWASKCC